MLLPNRFSFGGKPSIESDHLQPRSVATHSGSRSEFSKPNGTGAVLLAIIVFLLEPFFSCLGSVRISGIGGGLQFRRRNRQFGTECRSGNNINGTVVGATWVANGMYGNALAFKRDQQLR